MESLKTSSISLGTINMRHLSDGMICVLSDNAKFQICRQLIVSLIEARVELGIDDLDAQVLKQLNYTANHVNREEFIQPTEKLSADDLNIFDFASKFPAIKDVIVSFSDSHFVESNKEILILRQALLSLRSKLVDLIRTSAQFANQYQKTPTFIFSYPTTLGEQATIWIQNIIENLQEIDFVLSNLKMIGLNKQLDTELKKYFPITYVRINDVNRFVASKFGFEDFYPLFCKDSSIRLKSINLLSSIALSIHTMARDILHYHVELSPAHIVQNSSGNVLLNISEYYNAGILLNNYSKKLEDFFCTTYGTVNGACQITELLIKDKSIISGELLREIKYHSSPSKLIKLCSARTTSFIRTHVNPIITE